MRLKNKFAIIVGGAVGIGAAITNIFAKEGCDLLITHHGEKEKIEAAKIAENVKKFGTRFYYEDLDVLKKGQVVSLFKRLPDYSKKLDIAVNNAGVSNMKNFVDLTEEDWDFNMNINAKGMFFCCQEEAKIMIKQNHGKIINTASLAAKIGAAFLAHYSASKFAVLGLTYTIALQLAKYNITVNAVCPGLVLTDMIKREWKWEADLRGMGEQEFIDEMKKGIPLDRYAKPEDIATMYLFLASDEANYITGQSYNVNGGQESH